MTRKNKRRKKGCNKEEKNPKEERQRANADDNDDTSDEEDVKRGGGVRGGGGELRCAKVRIDSWPHPLQPCNRAMRRERRKEEKQLVDWNVGMEGDTREGKWEMGGGWHEDINIATETAFGFTDVAHDRIGPMEYRSTKKYNHKEKYCSQHINF